MLEMEKSHDLNSESYKFIAYHSFLNATIPISFSSNNTYRMIHDKKTFQ